MTSNEKKVLAKFKEIKQGNTVTIAGTLRVTINYAYDVCKKLCEKGYLESLSPGRFALYRITSLGEEQVKTEGEGEKEFKADVDAEGEGRRETEGIEEYEYECVSCGAAVKEEDTECPKCGIVFEEGVEEAIEGSTEEQSPEQAKQVEGQSNEGTTESLDSSRDKLCEEVPPAPQSTEERSVVKEDDNVGRERETGILDHPSVPEDWKTCNWKWK